VRARRVTPVHDPEAIAVHERVLVVEIVVLDRDGQGVFGELSAEFGEPGREAAELLQFGVIQGQVRSDELVIQIGPALQPPVGNGRRHRRLTLEFRVPWEEAQPQLRRIVELFKRRARISQQQPAGAGGVREHTWKEAGPGASELRH
jgi:hypothetical protein